MQQGTLVRLKDTDAGHVGKGLAAVRDVLKERLERRHITRQQFDDMMTLTEQLVCDALQHACGTLEIPYGERTPDFRPPWPRVPILDEP